VLAPSAAHAEVVLLAQQRQIEAITSFDANTQVLSATNFQPFVQTLDLNASFPTPSGGQGNNRARADINCVVDPSSIRALGTLTGSGGLSLFQGTPRPETGEMAAFVLVTINVTTPTSFRLLASPRPSTLARDEFQIELEDVATGNRLFFLDETAPAQSVDFSGMLQPGQYSFQYQVELTVEDGNEVSRGFSFDFQLPAPGPACALALGLGWAGARRRRW
jgi:hypothetical protein